MATFFNCEGTGNNPYEGEYEVTPMLDKDQTLPTANKTMRKDVTVHEVPVFMVSNESGGYTVTICKE